MSEGVARRTERIRALGDRRRRLERVIAERARDMQLAGVPGGKTGLITHNVKGVGKGADFRLIDVYRVDVGLLRELREIERQAAQELGQWGEKHSVDSEELNARIERLLAELADRGEAETVPDAGRASESETDGETLH